MLRGRVCVAVGGDVKLLEQPSAVGQSIERAELAIIRTGPFADIVS